MGANKEILYFQTMKHDNERLRRASLNLCIQPARRNRLRPLKGSGVCVEYQSADKAVRGMVRIGKLMKETGTMPGGGTEQQTAADVLYGKSEG